MSLVCIEQKCKNNCGAKVFTTLPVGSVVPAPRECVFCKKNGTPKKSAVTVTFKCLNCGTVAEWARSHDA